MKKKLKELFKQIRQLVGRKYCWFSEEHDNKVDIQVIDDAEDDVRSLIEEKGFEIVEDSWFSGSDYDGCSFTISLA